MRQVKTSFFRCSFIPAVIFLAPLLPGQATNFRRGDANLDSSLDLSDAVASLRFLFLSGEEPRCRDAVDANDDGNLDVSDPVRILSFLFLGGSAPPAPGLLCGSDPTEDALTCQAYEACTQPPIPGQSTFEYRTQGPPPGGGPMGRDAEDGAVFGADGGPAPPAADPGGAPVPPERLIEESDIWKLIGEDLFVLNRYRGLQIIDIKDLDRPKLVGRAPIFGYPKEMYVRGTNAYVIVSDYYTFWREEAVLDDVVPHAFYGSQLRIIDISDPRHPRVTGGINLDGEVADSRIVGEVMYLVSNRYPWYYWWRGTTDNVDQTQVYSVDISNPAKVAQVDRKDIPRNGWEHHLSVTARTIYLASSGWVGSWMAGGYETRIRIIDISDPAGAIRLRGETVAPGRVQDRWSMDEFEGALRVASGRSWWNGDVFLTTYSVENPDEIKQLGQYTLHVNERLTAARFDGPRGYLVSYRNIDPLFTFDLADPARPRLLGELKLSGWLDFIVPQGDRLVALGHEDLQEPGGWRRVTLAVSLVDVASQGEPKLLSRVPLTTGWASLPTWNRDDFAKVFKVVPELGLILFPFQGWDQENYRYLSAVQLIDYTRDSLTRRGRIEDGGWVERGIPHGENTVLTISSTAFQVMDIADRDQPRLRGKLELARNVQQLAIPSAPAAEGFTVQLAGDWYRGNAEVLTTPLDDPDAAEPLGKIQIAAPYGRMFTNGTLAYVASIQEVRRQDGTTAQATKVQVVDLGDPSAPRLRGEVTLPEPVWVGYHNWYWGWGDQVVQVNSTTLAFHRYFNWWRCLNCLEDRDAGEVEPYQKLYLVDLEDPDRPVLASTVSFPDVDWAWGLKASGSILYLTIYRTRQEAPDTWVTRYFLRRFEVSEPARPVELVEVNIPGMLVDATPDGQTLYTQEFFCSSSGGTHTAFYVLALEGDKAYLQSKVETPGYLNNVLVAGSAAFASYHWWEVKVVNGTQVWDNKSLLMTIDLRDPRAVRIAGQAELPFDYAYLQAVVGSRAFLGSYAGIFVYDVYDLSRPTFEEFFRTQGWSQEIVVHGERAYVPSGFHGVQVLDLGADAGTP